MSSQKSLIGTAKEQWTSELGFILSALGSAIGLGSIWRFPFLAYEGGGAAFIIAYIIAMVGIGTPLIIMEFGLGFKTRAGAPFAFAKYNRHWEWLGWWSLVFVLFGTQLYYNVIIAWCLTYLKYSFTLAWGADSKLFFNEVFLNKTSGPFVLGGIQWEICFFLILTVFLNWLIIYRGINKGLEKANKIFIPTIAFLMLSLFFWSLTLDGADIGIKSYFITSYESLLEGRIWFNAFSQAFFSLSIGFGIMIVFASYLPKKKTNLTKAALLTVYGTTAFAIFSGCIVFAVLGFMSKAQGVPISSLMAVGPGLAFITYPEALNEINRSISPYVAKVAGAFFFLSLFIAGLSSSISILEAAVKSLKDKFGWNRERIITGISIISITGGIPFVTQGGIHWIDMIDHFITNYSVVIIGLLECILIGWFANLGSLKRYINANSTIQLRLFWDIRIQFISPFILLYLLSYMILQELLKPYNGYPIEALLMNVAFMIGLVVLAVLISIIKPIQGSHQRFIQLIIEHKKRKHLQENKL